jgi:hypothetical protein
MPRYSAAGRTVTNLPTAARGPGVFAGATGGAFVVRQVAVFNTTTTAVCVGLAVCTATGTQVGTIGPDRPSNDPSAANWVETAFTSQSSDSTVDFQEEQASLGAAIGAGIIWTWGEQGLVLAEGTANGVIINCPTGTAQHLDFTIKWEK